MEKPPRLYHGSPNKTIEEFEPRVSKGTGEKFGALVYATSNLAIASIFLSEVKKTWSAGRFGDVPYALITVPREEFITHDKGGYVYVFSSKSFESDPKRGLGEYEWASKEKVKPIEKIEYPSALEAMLENGVQVYFVDDEMFKRIKSSQDHGLFVLQSLESENQKRSINVRLFENEPAASEESSN